MQVIRPGKLNVPRGTLPTIWRHPFEPHELEAAAAGQKRQFRTEITGGNSSPPGRRRFSDLDLTFARADTFRSGVASVLHCRVRDERPPRTVVLAPQMKLGDVVFAGGLRTQLADATDSMLITAIYPQRLRAITEAEAILEGTHTAWAIRLAGTHGAAHAQTVLAGLFEEVGKRQRREWIQHEEKAEEPTARNIFGLDFLRRAHGGFQRWRVNPWMWVITFEWYPVRPSDLILRLANGTIERKRA